MKKLSVLICTIPSRTNMLAKLLEILLPQATPEVEVLWLGDNKRRSIGYKRNALLAIAQGDYVTFIDDDDRVAGDYVKVILAAIRGNPGADVITFVQMVSVNGGRPKPCYYGVELEYCDRKSEWTGKPSHTMVWRRELAASELFNDQSQGEDVDWAKRASLRVKVQVQLPDRLYHYDYNVKVSERP